MCVCVCVYNSSGRAVCVCVYITPQAALLGASITSFVDERIKPAGPAAGGVGMLRLWYHRICVFLTPSRTIRDVYFFTPEHRL